VTRFTIATVPQKVLLYSSLRVVYPLVNFLGTEWGFSKAEMGVVLAAGELAAIPAGFVSPFGDKYGNRGLAQWSWTLVFLSSLLMLVPPTLAGMVVIRVLIHFFATLYMILAQSTLVSQVAEESRGFVTGITELSWGLSILTYVPLLTVIYDQAGWRTTFGVISLSLALLFYEVRKNYPADDRALRPALNDSEIERGQTRKETLNQLGLSFRQITSTSFLSRFRSSKYWSCLVSTGPLLFNMAAVFINVSHNLLFIAFANWAFEEHNLEPQEMGAATFGIGATELLGNFVLIFFADSFGILRFTLLNLGCFAGAIGLFFWLVDSSFIVAVVLIAVAYLPGEIVVVALIAVAERFVAEDMRTTVLGINYQANFVGRAIGALIAEPLWRAGGLLASCFSSIGLLVVAFGLIVASEPFMLTDQTPSFFHDGKEEDDGQEAEKEESEAQVVIS